MSATRSTAYQPAMFAGQDRAERMPFSMPTMCMTSAAAASASTILVKTDVLASVSLFVLVLIVFLSLLTVLLGLISLSGLTGCISLVGLTNGQDPGTVQGD